MRLSIVIPAHNEAANIERFVAAFLQKLPPELGPTEVLLVENGSRDDTLQACRRLQERFPAIVRVLSIGRPSYGEAVKHGILESRGTLVSVLECDVLDVDFVTSSVGLLQSDEALFVVASKRHPDSVDRRPLKRRLLTAVYNGLLLRIFLGYPGTDTHGLKSIDGAFAKQLCRLAITSDEIFQTELVLLAWRLGIKIHERPITIREMRPAPVSVLKRTPKVLNTIRALKRSLSRFSGVPTPTPERRQTRGAQI